VTFIFGEKHGFRIFALFYTRKTIIELLFACKKNFDVKKNGTDSRQLRWRFSLASK
jgi:hypothetical protein